MATPMMPMLSSSGWQTDPEELMNSLFTLSFKTDYSQTSVFPTSISSLQYLTTKYYTQPDELVSQVKAMYLKLYSRFFTNVNVDCRLDNDSAATFSFSLDVSGQSGGVTYQLGRIVEAKGSGGEVTILDIISGSTT